MYNALRVVSIILYFNYRKYSLDKEVYHSEINGHIKSIRQVGRGDGYIQLKLKNENNFHPEAIIYLGSNNKNEMKNRLKIANIAEANL